MNTIAEETGIHAIPLAHIPVKSPDASPMEYCTFRLWYSGDPAQWTACGKPMKSSGCDWTMWTCPLPMETLTPGDSQNAGLPHRPPLVASSWNFLRYVHLKIITIDQKQPLYTYIWTILIFVFLFLLGEILAKDFECYFAEVAAAEQVTQVAEVFNELCREVTNVRRKNKQSLLDRVLGNKGGLRTYSRGKSDSALPKEWKKNGFRKKEFKFLVSWSHFYWKSSCQREKWHSSLSIWNTWLCRGCFARPRTKWLILKHLLRTIFTSDMTIYEVKFYVFKKIKKKYAKEIPRQIITIWLTLQSKVKLCVYHVSMIETPKKKNTMLQNHFYFTLEKNWRTLF